MDDLKQAQVKYTLVSKCFNTDEWKVIVDFDSQEAERDKYIEMLKKFKVTTRGGRKQKTYIYRKLNRPDIYAEDSNNVYIIEVEGGNPKQKETKIYSALGQTLFSMIDHNEHDKNLYFGLAVPDDESWMKALKRIPKVNVRQRLNLYIFLVSEENVRMIAPSDEIENVI